MAEGARVGSVVMFVQDLERSVNFYADVLVLEVADRSPTAALLSNADGASVILRAMGHQAGEEDLARAERALAARGAHRETRSHGGVTLAEGRDPDGIVVMICYPGPDQRPLRELPARIYGW